MWVWLFSFCFGFCAITVRAADCPDVAKETLKGSRQLIVVTSPRWDSPLGSLETYTRDSSEGGWRKDGLTVRAVMGNRGLGWGHNYAPESQSGDPVKKEGDKKAPIGFFPLGQKFGFEAKSDKDYLQLTRDTVCVDDPNSNSYNQVVDASKVRKDWKSAEQMSSIDLYRLGFEVKYTSNAKARAGSCIFLHVWRESNKGTAGCVAISEDDMRRLHTEVDPKKNPVVGIFPQDELPNWLACIKGVKAATSEQSRRSSPAQ